MANRRMISSDIWEDDWFGQLDFFEQALWIGLFSKCADDQGRLLNNPVLLRAAIFPYKDIPLDDIEQAVREFAHAERVILYTTDSKNVLQLVNWWEHQRPQWAQPSKWAAPEGWRDRIRTRDGGVYRAENWREPRPETSKAELTPTSTAQSTMAPEGTTLSDNLVRQYPVPVPVYVPVQEEIAAVAPPAPAAPVKKSNGKADPRTKHPAIQAIREVTKLTPLKGTYDPLIAVLGDTPDVERLKRCFEVWSLKGWRPTNYAWVTDWYVNGIPAQQNGHGARASPAKHDATAADWQAEARKFAPIIAEEDA
jgi:hypothetical protein